MRVLHPLMCECKLCSKLVATFTSSGPSPTSISLEAIREAAARIERLPKAPTKMWVRRDSWPSVKLQLEARGVNTLTEARPMLFGVPIIIVDYLPRPWMTDLDLPLGVGEP